MFWKIPISPLKMHSTIKLSISVMSQSANIIKPTMDEIASKLITQETYIPFYFAFTAEIKPSTPARHGTYSLHTRYHKLVTPLKPPIPPNTMPPRIITMGFSAQAQVPEISFSFTGYSKHLHSTQYIQQLRQARHYDNLLTLPEEYPLPSDGPTTATHTTPPYDIIAQTMSDSPPPWYVEFRHTKRMQANTDGHLITMMPKDTLL
jgi:hypothetical protein